MLTRTGLSNATAAGPPGPETVARFRSVRWPASGRNGGPLQIGTVARFASELWPTSRRIRWPASVGIRRWRVIEPRCHCNVSWSMRCVCRSCAAVTHYPVLLAGADPVRDQSRELPLTMARNSLVASALRAAFRDDVQSQPRRAKPLSARHQHDASGRLGGTQDRLGTRWAISPNTQKANVIEATSIETNCLDRTAQRRSAPDSATRFSPAT